LPPYSFRPPNLFKRTPANLHPPLKMSDDESRMIEIGLDIKKQYKKKLCKACRLNLARKRSPYCSRCASSGKREVIREIFAREERTESYATFLKIRYERNINVPKLLEGTKDMSLSSIIQKLKNDVPRIKLDKTVQEISPEEEEELLKNDMEIDSA
jgi:predicted amidophosphoribosyltransferase